MSVSVEITDAKIDAYGYLEGTMIVDGSIKLHHAYKPPYAFILHGDQEDELARRGFSEADRRAIERAAELAFRDIWNETQPAIARPTESPNEPTAAPPVDQILEEHHLPSEKMFGRNIIEIIEPDPDEPWDRCYELEPLLLSSDCLIRHWSDGSGSIRDSSGNALADWDIQTYDLHYIDGSGSRRNAANPYEPDGLADFANVESLLFAAEMAVASKHPSLALSEGLGDAIYTADLASAKPSLLSETLARGSAASAKLASCRKSAAPRPHRAVDGKI